MNSLIMSKSEHNRPYVGITGITRMTEVEQIQGIISELAWPTDRSVMLGMLVSYRTLISDQPSNYRQYPSRAGLNGLADSDPRLLNLIHYNSRTTGLHRQIVDLMDGLAGYAGMQLNVPWPDPAELHHLRQRIYMKVVLQVGKSAWAMVGRRPERVVAQLARYQGLAEYVLLDMSGGLGVEFDTALAQELVHHIATANLGFRIGVAGGFSANTVAKLTPLLAIDPHISWDAQGRLRDGRDLLDLGACREYLAASAEVLRQSAAQRID